MKEFKVVVAGSRQFKDYKLLCDKLDSLFSRIKENHKIVIISGLAKGADELGGRYAKERGFELIEVPADWDRHGKSAGYKRNQVMAEMSDASVVFWDGKSKGSSHMIDITKKNCNMLKVIRY